MSEARSNSIARSIIATSTTQEEALAEMSARIDSLDSLHLAIWMQLELLPVAA
jgi:hypothetical protein